MLFASPRSAQCISVAREISVILSKVSLTSYLHYVSACDGALG